MNSEQEHEQKLLDLLNKKLAANLAGYVGDDVGRLDAIERCMIKFQCLDDNGRPTVTPWMQDLVGEFMNDTHWGHLLQTAVIASGQSPIDLMVDSRNIEAMIKHAARVDKHHETCPNGAVCGNYCIFDMLIMHGRMPLWTWASYRLADDRDFEIMRGELSKWKNWRSVMGDS